VTAQGLDAGAEGGTTDAGGAGPDQGRSAPAGNAAATGGAAGGAGAGTYEAAAARVEEIIRRLDSGEASLTETLELVREGKGLIELCAAELHAVGDALQELRLDELVSRLEKEAER
jgi:exodeoxyribonuclease VII small subunit